VKRILAGCLLLVVALTACDTGSVNQTEHEHCAKKGASCAYGPTTSTTVLQGVTGTLRRGHSMSDALPALKSWCRSLQRIYRTETVPPQPALIDDTVHLIDQLQSIVSTGSGVEQMKATAHQSVEQSVFVLNGLRGGSLCSPGRGVGSSTSLVIVPST
jgi:hypothetical protein